MTLRSKLIRLASQNPSIRKEILSLLATKPLSKRASQFDGKMVSESQGWRLTYTDHQLILEELPAKGKKTLLVSTLYKSPAAVRAFDAWLTPNILRFSKISPSDSMEAIKQKILDYMTSESTLRSNIQSAARIGWEERFVREDTQRVQWYTDRVHFLKVTPENTPKILVQGKDFVVEASWLEFSAYSPDSDLENHDPSYTKYVSKSSASARKFYQMARVEPKILSGVSWNEFGSFLQKAKIPYDTRFSVWR